MWRNPSRQRLFVNSWHAWKSQVHHHPLTQSGPIVVPKSVHTMAWILCNTCVGMWCPLSGTVPKKSAKLAAMALHRAGGYSLSTAVRKCPLWSSPIERVFGTSALIAWALMCFGRVGKLRVSKVVLLALSAPRSPCAKTTLSKPGSCSKRIIKGNFQMLGLSGSAGSDGCSSTPDPSTCSRSIIQIRLNARSLCPSRICLFSRMDKDQKPHSSAAERMGRGPVRPSCAMLASVLPRAADHVQQGGPPIMPMTYPL